MRVVVAMNTRALNYALRKLDLTTKEDINRYLNKITLGF